MSDEDKKKNPPWLQDPREIGRPRWADGTPVGGALTTDKDFEDQQAQEALTELGDDDFEFEG